MARGYFVTGTDTGVGKTLVTGALARALVGRGKRVGVMKPFETGCGSRGGGLVPEDALFLKAMAQSTEAIERICPCRLRYPLAPWIAAALEQVTIDVQQVARNFDDLKSRCDVMLVEGAGGLMVPITETVMNIDLAKLFALPLIIVARLSLGTINHTLLTVQQALSRGISVAGIVLNQLTPEQGIAEQTNPDAIRSLARVPVLGQMPYVPEDRRNDAGFLAAWAASNLTANFFS